MTYQPLARKYRPAQFNELVGQDAVALALANAVAMGREPHALIFTGVRGVGKTTIARLYAKALNCETPGPGSEPCNTCPSCRAIAAGNHEDVLEIDGASNTGVADVRALQETIDYVPQRSAFKVYIIDEVHMLSQAAFNALLKTLEEPPSHVIFIFATTELQKVPQTILSRCQSFYLKKLPLALIRDRLQLILTAEGIKADERALTVIAREGHGSMRDALTLLDQAIALGHGEVSLAALGPLVSKLSSSPHLELLAAMVQRDAARAMGVIAELDQGGVEFAVVAEETAQLARHGFVLQGLGAGALDAALLGLDDGEVERLTAIAGAAAPFDLNRVFRTLVQCRTELDGSALDRFVLENYVFEWCFDPGLPDLDTLLSGGPTPSGRGAGSGHAAPRTQQTSAGVPLSTTSAPPPSSAQPAPRAVPTPAPPAPRPAEAAPAAAPRPAEAASAAAPRPAEAASAAAPPTSPLAEAPAAPKAHVSLSGMLDGIRGQANNRGGASSRVVKPAPASAPEQPAARPSPAPPAPTPRAAAAPSPMTLPRPGAASGSAPRTMPPVPDFDDIPLPGEERHATASAHPAAAPLKTMPRPTARDAAGAPGVVPPRAAATGHPGDEAPPVTSDAGPLLTFPPSWRHLVDIWRQKKPLSARKLEEAHPVSYTSELIVLAVSEDSYASRILLQREEQARVREHFRELFGFQGTLQVVPRGDAVRKIDGNQTDNVNNRSDGPAPMAPDHRGYAPDPAAMNLAVDLPATVLSERTREAQSRRQALLDEARSVPFTRDVLAALGGTIEDVRIPDEHP